MRRARPLAALAALTLWGATRSSVPARDGIAFTGLNGDAVVVVDGKKGSSCWRDKVFRTSGPIDFGGTIKRTSGCPSEVDVFTAEGGVVLEVAPEWSHDPASPLMVNIPPVRRIDLSVVVVEGNVPDALSWARTAIDEVNTFFGENRIGIQVTTSTFMTATPSQAQTIGNNCETAGALKQSGPAAGVYDPDRINVYFVPWIDMLGYGLWLGYNCFEPNGSGVRAPNVIFVSLLYGVYSTASHELGHALGLRWLNAHSNPGAQDGRVGFPVTNLMYSYVDRATAAAQNRFSLGQAYRMNIDSASWLNRTGQTSTASMKKECQPEPTKNRPCPRLALDLPSP
jgi:hypothetical protein